MKVLVLSCTTGEGHNSAAYAICEELEQRGVECEFTDALQFAGEKVSSIVSASYSAMILNAPALFGLVYAVGDLYSSTKLASPVYWANSAYAQHLYQYIVEGGYNAVISTHLFPMEALTHIRRVFTLNVPCFAVLTDYTCIPFFEQVDADAFFLPNESVLEKCADKGMQKNRLHVTGIPVAKRFTQRMSKDEARNYLVISKDTTLYLIMTGGVGCGNVLALVEALFRADDESMLIYVLAGRNSDLMERLHRRYSGNARVQGIAFTEKVNVYMCAADVLITKPGGISSTEAAALNIPLVHAMPIPGCETQNAELFSACGMSLYAHNPREAAMYAVRLTRDHDATKQMRHAQQAAIPLDSAKKIVDLIMR